MSTSGLDLHATVDANVSGFVVNIEKAHAEALRFQKTLDSQAASAARFQKSLDDKATAALARNHTAMTNTGRAALLFGGAVAAGFGVAIDQAIKWQSAWTGVLKTTNGNAAQMADLEQQLRDLTKILPASHTEIAAVAEAAGQLGIQRQNIAQFTKVMIDMGQATDLSSDQAATSIAQFMNVMGNAAPEVENIGNTIARLGNKGASTETQIMEMAQRLSGSGKLIGASSADVLGMASAMANLGIQAQLGGGAMQRTLLTIYSLMKQGGASVDKLASVAGVSADQFASVWEKRPMQAVNMFVQGLGHIKASGGNVVQTLNDLGLSGTQNLGVLLRLAGAGDMITTSLATAANGWEKNNALVKEAAQRYGTTASQIAIARNDMVDASIDIGNMLLPALAKVVTTGRDLIAFWQDLPKPLRGAVTIIALAGAAVTLFGGLLLMAIPKIAAFNLAVTELEAGPMKTMGTRLQSTAGVLMGPWGAALTVATVGLGAYAVQQQKLKQAVDDAKTTLDEQTGAITDNTQAWVIKSLSDKGALDAANAMGISMGALTAAAMGNKKAFAEVATEFDAAKAAGKGTNDQQMALVGALGSVGSALGVARDKWKLENQAKADSTGGSKKATAAQKGTTQAWQDGASAASDLSGEVKTLGSELEDAAGAYLSNRDAGRQVRDALRGIREAMNQYVKDHGGLVGAFKGGTKSGDSFAGMLDQLAKDYQNQIDTTEQVTGSEKRVQAVYDDSRKNLLAVAQQLGMTKTQALDYVNQILQVPSIVPTHFTQPGMDGATSAAQNYVSWLDGIPREVVTHFIAHHDPTIGPAGRPGGPQSGNSGGGRGGPESGGGGGGVNPRRWFHDPKTSRGAITGSPRSSGSGGGDLTVSGTLDTPWGPAEVHGIATGAAHRVYSERHESDQRHEEAHG